MWFELKAISEQISSAYHSYSSSRFLISSANPSAENLSLLGSAEQRNETEWDESGEHNVELIITIEFQPSMFSHWGKATSSTPRQGLLYTTLSLDISAIIAPLLICSRSHFCERELKIQIYFVYPMPCL